MVRYLLDTNILGYFVRKPEEPLRGRMLQAMYLEEVAISVLTRAETRYGLARLQPNDKRQASVNLLLDEYPTLPWTTRAADCYGNIAAMLDKRGQPIGVMDTLIAAHAVAENLILVTHNTRHFERVPGLTVEDWTV